MLLNEVLDKISRYLKIAKQNPPHGVYESRGVHIVYDHIPIQNMAVQNHIKSVD